MNNKVFWMGGNEGKVYDMPRKLEGRHYKVVTIEVGSSGIPRIAFLILLIQNI